MDPQLQELQREVRRVAAMTEDTNRTLHKMRRHAVWGRFFTVLWWLLVIGASGAAYYYYAQPYVQKLEALYSQVAHTSAQAQSYQQKISNFFANFVPPASTSSTTTQ